MFNSYNLSIHRNFNEEPRNVNNQFLRYVYFILDQTKFLREPLWIRHVTLSVKKTWSTASCSSGWNTASTVQAEIPRLLSRLKYRVYCPGWNTASTVQAEIPCLQSRLKYRVYCPGWNTASTVQAEITRMSLYFLT